VFKILQYSKWSGNRRNDRELPRALAGGVLGLSYLANEQNLNIKIEKILKLIFLAYIYIYRFLC
jgi:hypothetical protein